MDIIERLNASLDSRYVVDRQVGEGGMARVYLAYDRKHDRKVALKVVKPELVTAQGKDRFLQEIRVTANLQHPHILPLFDSGEADGLLFYVMPYVEGESLRERLAREGKLPISDAVRLLRDVLGGLAAAHRFGVVHQDVKPGNVLISGRRAMVADFGVARAVSQASERSTDGRGRDTFGSPAYMSPEQAAGSTNVDHRADIYAVGCLAYHMLVGWPPFHGRTPRQTLTAHVVEDVVPLSESRPSVPSELGTLVMRCLAKDPADRWQRVDEILDQLEGVTTSDHDIRPVRPLLPRGRALATVAVMAGLVVAVVAFALDMSGPGGSGPTGAQSSADLPRDYVAVFPFQNLTGEVQLDPLGPLAAYILTDGAGRLEGLRMVSEPAVGQAVLDAENEGVVRLAENLGAGVAVSGVYSLNGTVLEFRAEVFGVPGGEFITGIEALGPASDPQAVVIDLQQRTLSALSQEVLGQEGPRGLSVMVPTLGAFRVFLQGRRAFNAGEFARALPFLHQAFELDTTFVEPLAIAASANINLGRYAVADSLVRMVQARRDLLSPTGMQYLEWARSLFSGDVEAQLRNVRGLAETYGTNTWTYLLGNTALHAGKPIEARQALARLEGDILEDWYFATSRLSRANHSAGHYQEALDVARRGREIFPEVPAFDELELRALIRLDRLDEIEPLLDAMAVSGDWQGGPPPGTVLLGVASELARTGRRREARSVGDRALGWYLARDRPEERAAIAQVHILLGRGPEALAVLAPLVQGNQDDVRLRGMHGVALALSGDRRAAEGVLEWLETLERPYTFGSASYWSAATLAHLGQESESVQALRRAFEEGHSYLRVQADPNLSPLWGFEPFEQAIAPSG